MSEQVSRPELDKPEERPVFNLDLLTDDQVIWLNRALFNEYERRLHAEDHELGEGFLNVLQGNIRALMSHDPERGAVLIEQLAEGSNTHDLETALECLPALAESNCTLAMTLLLRIDDRISDDQISRGDSGVLINTIIGVVEELPKHVGSAEAADFRARWQPRAY